MRTILRFVLVSLAVLLVYGLFGSDASRGAVVLWNILSTPIIETAGSSISLVTVIFAIPIGYVAVWTARTGSGFLKTRALSRLPLTDATRFSIGGITHYLILSVTLVIGLSFLGVNLSTFSVLIGTLGIGIGFGLQNVVASFVSGLVIIFERPIKEGDRVVVEGTEGDVAHIRLRSTIITTLTDETIIVPNHQLIGNKIYNNSHEVRRITVINQVSVAYGTDLDYAAEVLKGVAVASPYARASAEPDVRVREFGDSGILMELWTGIEDAGTSGRRTPGPTSKSPARSAAPALPFPFRNATCTSRSCLPALPAWIRSRSPPLPNSPPAAFVQSVAYLILPGNG